MTSTSPASQPAEMYALVGGVCDVRCVFCHERSGPKDDFPVREQYLDSLGGPFLTPEALRAALAEGAPERLLFEGGEPLLHPGLPELIRAARESGVGSIGVVTNGVRLSRPGALDALVSAGLDEVAFSIHGGCAEVHDGLTLSPGSFDKLLAALEQSLSRGLRVKTHTVLNAKNAADVPKLLKLLAGYPEVRPIGISTMYLNGSARLHADELMAPPAELARHVADGLRGLTDEQRARVNVAGLPACLLPEFQDRVISYEIGSSLGPKGVWVGRMKGVQGPPCAACAKKDGCDGIWSEYAERFGWTDLRPFPAGGTRPLDRRDRRLAEGVEAAARLAAQEGRSAVVPDSMADDLKLRAGAERWLGYSSRIGDLEGAGAVLAYPAELHRLPAGFAASLFKAWQPVQANEACVVFARPSFSRGRLPAGDPALRSLARFTVQLGSLERSGGAYRAASGLSFHCGRGLSDVGAVEEAWGSYFPRLDLRRGATVVDLGAHIGGFALPAALRAPEGRVLAFEPDPESRALLERNVLLNRIPNVEVSAAAVWARDGRGELRACPANPVLSNLFRPYGAGGAVETELISLPSLFEKHRIERADILKVDIEGAEYEVLLSCPELVRERVGALIVEVHEREGLAPESIERFLADSGFRVERAGDVLFALERRS
jgi:cyclic pyranopterin phosphate synthase